MGAASVLLHLTVHYLPGIALSRTDRQTVSHPWPFLLIASGSPVAPRETRPRLWPASSQSHTHLSVPCSRPPTVFSTPQWGRDAVGSSFHTANSGPPLAGPSPQSPRPLSGSTRATKLTGSPEDT